MVQTAETIWRDFATDGIPASGPHNPRKPLVREWGTWVEGFLTAIGTNGGLIYATRADLFADLDHDEPASAWVVADATSAYNGIYRKSEASGSGSWTYAMPLPYSYISASDVGDGTPDAIQATTSVPIPDADKGALVALNIFEDNTGSPVTVSFNGGSALTIKTNSGQDIAAGGLTAGTVVAGYKVGNTFRLLTDQVSEAIVAQAEAAAAAAQAAADSIEPENFVVKAAGAQAIVDANADALANTLSINREANYTGGEKGWVNSALRLDTYARDGTASFEWTITGVSHNYANVDTSAPDPDDWVIPENVGGYFQGNQHGTSGTWGGVFEVCDHRDRMTQSGDFPTWGSEIDCWTNQADPMNLRRGLVIVAGNKKQVRDGNDTPGDLAIVGAGLDIQSYGGFTDNALHSIGVVVNGVQQSAFVANIFGQRGFEVLGTYGIGLDTSGATLTSGTAVRMEQGQAISFDDSDDNRMYLDGGALQVFMAGGQRFAMFDTGKFRASSLEINANRTLIDGTFDSGTATATLATNKPGSNTSTGTWLKVVVDGTTGWVPWFPH